MTEKAPPEKKSTPQTASQKSEDPTRSFLSLGRPFSPPPPAPPPVNRLHTMAPGTRGLLSRAGVAILPPGQKASNVTPFLREPSVGTPASRIGAVVQRRIAAYPTHQPGPPLSSEYIRTEAGRGIRGRGNSLPHMEQIQRSFGQRHDLSSIKAHVGGTAGEASRRIGAEAYAMGEHVAFREEPDLYTSAHEAAHIVQQRGGVYVAGGVGQVGDAYERQADAVADRVVLGQSSEALLSASAAPFGESPAGGPSSSPLQMRIKSYNTNGDDDLKSAYETKVGRIEEKVNNAVISARREALNWRNYQNSNGHLWQWYRKAEAFNDDPDVTPRLIHAKFGYAIETLTDQALPQNMEGLAIQRQVTEGGTRPDIVLKDLSNNIEVAWLDITSEDSIEHIFRKSGSGWRNRPFVAEILYNALQLFEILTGVDDPLLREIGTYKADRAQVRHDNIENHRNDLANDLVDFQDEISHLGKTERKKETQQRLIDWGMNIQGCQVAATKGTLLYCGLNYGPYGFSGGSTTISRAQQYVEEQAKRDIETGLKDLNLIRILGIKDRLRQINVNEKNDFDNRIDQARPQPSSRRRRGPSQPREVDMTDFVYEGIALIHALTARTDADDVIGQLVELRSDDQRIDQAADPINDHLENFPTTRDYNSLQNWASTMYQLIHVANSLHEILEKKEEFEDFLYDKYYSEDDDISNWMDDMNNDESVLHGRLSDWPLDNDIVNDADEYMNTGMDIDD